MWQKTFYQERRPKAKPRGGIFTGNIMNEDTMIAIGKRLVLGIVILFAVTQGLSIYLDWRFEHQTGQTIQELAR